MAKHKQKQEQENEEAVMSLTGHLKELRNRVLIVIAVLFAGLLICFNYAGPIVNLLTEQGTELGYQFVYLSPQALFMQYIKVALIGAVCLGSPVILYEIWAFIRPGLERRENFVFFFAMVAGFSSFSARFLLIRSRCRLCCIFSLMSMPQLPLSRPFRSKAISASS